MTTECYYSAMRESDLSEVLDIEREVFAHPWTRDYFRLVMADRNNYFIILKKESLTIGYGGCHFLKKQSDFLASVRKNASFVHLINIAIKPEFQKQGYGTFLLNTILNHARARNSSYCYLEVRPSNSAALSFYQKMGFSIVGVVENYYPQEFEDALVMGKELQRLYK